MARTQEIIQQLLKLGYSQTRLAVRIGMPQARISRWASGQVPNAAEDALKLAALLEAESNDQKDGDERAEQHPAMGRSDVARVEAD